MPIGAARAGLLLPSGVLPLVAPSQLASGTGSGVASVTSSSIAPTAGTLLAIFLGARDATEADVYPSDTPVTLSGLSIDGAWEVYADAYEDTGTTRWIGGSILLAKAASSPGTGTIQMNMAGSCFSIMYDIYEITQGFAADLSSYPETSNGVEATSLQLTVTPSASSLALSCAVINGDPTGAVTAPTGWSAASEVAQGSNATMKAAWKLRNAAANPTWAAIDANKRTTGVYREVTQNA